MARPTRSGAMGSRYHRAAHDDADKDAFNFDLPDVDRSNHRDVEACQCLGFEPGPRVRRMDAAVASRIGRCD